MNWEAARLVFEAAVFLFNFGILVFLIYLKRQSTDRGDFDELSRIVTRHDEQLKNVPTQQDMSDHRVGLTEVRGAVDTLAAEVHGIGNMLPPLQNAINLINEWMLKQP